MADLPLLASIEALEARLGRGTLAGPQREQALAALQDASGLVRAETGRTWVSTTGELTAPANVVTVTLQAALRVVRNPDGLVAETIGPFSRRMNDTDVYLLEAELELLRKYAAAPSGLWVQPTTRGEFWGVPVWVDDQYGGDSILYDERLT